MTEARVSAVVLNWNQREYLQECLNSLERQTHPPAEIVIVDNGSTDGSAKMLELEFPRFHAELLNRNYGYTGGYNRGLRETREEYLLLLNADVVLEPSFIEEAVRVMDADARIGMVQGKLYQMAARSEGTERRLDSMGLVVHRDRRVSLRGYGEVDRGQYDRSEEIFAPDGAAPLYRRAMLEDIRIGDAYFDEAFFMYREEVDLGWRARWRGWKAVTAPRAVGYHVRRYAPGTRHRQSRWLRRLQRRNRYCLMVKHETWQTLTRDLLPILWFEVRAFWYSLVVEPSVLWAHAGVVRLLPHLWRQRRMIQARRAVPVGDVSRWFR